MVSHAIIDTDRLPLGRIGFSNIRKKGKIYVDKTALINRIAKQDAPIFLSRPRRFGKSLLINTLHSLFEKNIEDFVGLDIEKTWTDTTYTVVHFDFSRMIDNSIRDIKFTLSAKIITEFGLDNTLIDSNSPKLQYPDIILDETLKKTRDNSLVLLVDEYDTPLTHSLDNEELLQDIIVVFNKFYATIKQYTDKFRFIFITGVTRSSHVSIFSAFNNLVDISLDNEFNSILGFTKDDLVHYFDLYIENAAHILKMSKNDVYERLEQYYDGFQFSLESEQTLYNPWSILCFLNKPSNGFKNYWFKSGGTSSIIIQYLKVSDTFDFLNYNNRDIFVNEDELSSIYEINQIPRHILLYQSGYFTLRNDDGIPCLVLPNEEVEESLFRLYLTSNNLSPNNELIKKMKKLSRDIDNKNLHAIIDVFNDILNECISTSSNIFSDERSIRDIIYAALIQISSLQKIKERETAQGKSDLELITGKTCMIIEFKRTYPNRGAKSSLEKAIEQIKNNQYGLLFSQTHSLYRVGMVVSTEKKMILHDFCKEVL